jgi:hypothetical protein
MSKKQKVGELVRFILRDPENREVVRDISGKAVTETAYTPKAAKHQAKAMFGQTMILERAS